MLKSMSSPPSGAHWRSAAPADTSSIGIWPRMVAAVRASLHAVAERRRMRHAEADLQGLDDRMLKDIGLTRSEIGRATRHGHHR
jgi:uncharacterized protein YjiS (DUF1127 family)